FGKRTQLVAHLARLLDAHLRLERDHLYAACGARWVDRAPIYDACEDHELLEHAASALLKTRVSDVRFGARLRSVRELFARKVKSDERRLFQRAKAALGDEELDRIGDAIARG